jgi:itaconate CoA-transferase
VGKRIDISMLESMAEWMSYPLYYAFDGAPPPPRAGASHATIYPYGPFPSGDGKTVMLGLQNEREWQVFCTRVLQQPELANDVRFASNGLRAANKTELQALIEACFAQLSAQQIVARLEDAQIANAQVNTMADVWAHPQLQARERWVQVGTPAGPVPALLPPGTADVTEACMNAVPALGEHTERILQDLGWAAPDIAALRAAQAI